MEMRDLGFGVIGTFVIMAAVGCGQAFSATGAGGNGGGGATGSGGAGGAASTSSSGSTGTGGGKPCTVGDLSSCGQGEYCQNVAQPTCAKCYDFSNLNFGKPQKLDFDRPDKAQALRFPRIGQKGELLFTYTVVTGGVGDDQLGHATAMGSMKWDKGQPEPTPPNSMLNDSAMLLLPNGSSLNNLVDGMKVNTGGGAVFLFNSVPIMAPLSQQIFAINPGAKMYDQVKLMGGDRNYNIAVSWQAQKPRFWYVSNANNSNNDELVTALPGNAPYSLSIKLDTGSCPAIAPFNPWVTPTGNWLLFSSPYSDEDNSCKAISGAPSHLFAISLKSAGQADDGQPNDAQATRLFKTSNSDLSTPSMSDDLCVLYYTETNGGDSDLYAAIRQ